MPWFSRKSKARPKSRSRIVKKRGSSAERILIFLKRSGIAIGAIVFIGWLGAWFFMSGASTTLAHWAQNKTLDYTADKGFRLANIYVEGRHYSDADAILAILNVEKHDPIFMVEPDAAREMLEKISWIKTAKVERQLPDSLYVKIEERTPMAIWQRDKNLSLIDTEGVVLTDKNLGRFKDFIILVGDDVPQRAPDLFKLLASEPEIYNKIEAAKSISNRRWDLVLKSGAIVKLPEEEVPLALRRLAKMQEDENILDKNIKSIDVRELTRITVRTKPGAVREYKANFQISPNGDAI
jgi:cell division protein FtsQ